LSLTLREEHRLRVFENRLLRRIFGPRRDEVTGEWRKHRNEELRDMYSSPIIGMMKSRRMRWTGHVELISEKRNRFKLLLGQSERKRPLGRRRRKWVDNIKMGLGEIGWGDTDWISLAQDRERCCNFISGSIN
jgi:hypothetical protein